MVGENMVPRVGLLGFGGVGRSLAQQLATISEAPRIVFALSSKGGVLVEGAGDLDALLELARSDKKLDGHPRFKQGLGLWKALEEAGDVDLVFVTLPPSYETGEPNLSIYRGLLDRGIGFITADKTGLARDYWGLREKARTRGAFMGYRATVAAGTPAIDLMRGLRGRPVERVRGVLNSTTNYILTMVEEGRSFQEAISRAVEEKLAEPDPRVDTHGLDAAAKITILACELGYGLDVTQVRRAPLEEVGEERVRDVIKQGYRVKYVAVFDASEKRASVRPVILPQTDPLARSSGVINVVDVEVENEHVTLTGPAGPAWRTARTMITDYLEYIGERNPRS